MLSELTSIDGMLELEILKSTVEYLIEARSLCILNPKVSSHRLSAYPKDGMFLPS